MPSFNKVMLIGNLTRDPQSKTLPGGTVLTEFGLAVNRKYRTQQGEDREEVTFVDCSAFGKTAETIAQYCQKGKPLFVEGRLKYDSWEDKGGGGKRSKLTITVENFQFLGARDPAPGDGEGSQQRPQQSQRQQAPQRPVSAMAGGGRGKPVTPPQEPPFGDEKMFEEADIPFAWEGRAGQLL